MDCKASALKTEIPVFAVRLSTTKPLPSLLAVAPETPPLITTFNLPCGAVVPMPTLPPLNIVICAVDAPPAVKFILPEALSFNKVMLPPALLYKIESDAPAVL